MLALLVGWLGFLVFPQKTVKAFTNGACCCTSGCSSPCTCPAGYSNSCQGVGANCDPIGTCYCTTASCCNGFGDWGPCGAPVNGICYTTRWCNNPTSCSEYQISQCSCGPICGDGSCNGSEDCSSCETDCGACCTPVDGGWTDWGACSVSCGGGTQTRTCTNPPPNECGAVCSGASSQACNTQPCPTPYPTAAITGGCGSFFCKKG